MKLSIQTAELALRESSESNPGAWADHSRFVAEACKNIESHLHMIFVRLVSVIISKQSYVQTIHRNINPMPHRF